MRLSTLQRIQRMLALISFTALFALVFIGARVLGVGLPDVDGLSPQALVLPAFNRHVVLISGHAGFDSGAVCEDAQGVVTLTEADVNARVAESAARRLRRAGADVEIFEEYDARLENLDADILLSLHADSCIETSGFKAAFHTNTSTLLDDQRLLTCIEREYAAATGLLPHPNTVTHDMTGYHAFNRIGLDTPAAILEMGFLGGDRLLLEENSHLAAKGVADSILCFLEGEPATPASP